MFLLPIEEEGFRTFCGYDLVQWPTGNWHHVCYKLDFYHLDYPLRVSIVSGPHQYASSIVLSSGLVSQPLLLDENFLLHILCYVLVFAHIAYGHAILTLCFQKECK